MSYNKESFGIMDECYFVPRGQIIDWINSLLQLNINKIQQLGSGSVYCQVFDVIHPGKVSMSRVNWKAKNDYEFISNLKILQVAFDKAGVKRYVEVEKLSKAKYQDNLEFIQWLKRYYDLNSGDRGSNYDADDRRGHIAVDFSFADKIVIPKQFNAKGQIAGGNKPDLPIKKPTQIFTKPSVISKTVEQKPKVSLTNNMKKPSSTTNWQTLYQNQVKKTKDLSLKLNMIEELVVAEESNDWKVSMIYQTINQNNQESAKMEIQNNDQNI